MQSNYTLQISHGDKVLAIVIPDLDGSDRIVFSQDTSDEMEQKIHNALTVATKSPEFETRMNSLLESCKKSGFRVEKIQTF